MKKEDLLITDDANSSMVPESANMSTVETIGESQEVSGKDPEEVVKDGDSNESMPTPIDQDIKAVSPLELLKARKAKIGNSVLDVLKSRKSGKDSILSVKEVLKSRRSGSTSNMTVKELLAQRKFSKNRGVKVL